MSDRSYILTLIGMLGMNMLISFLVRVLVPNYYLASIITSILIALVFSIINTQRQTNDGLRFFRYSSFWMSFFVFAIVLLGIDFLLFMLG